MSTEASPRPWEVVADEGASFAEIYANIGTLTRLVAEVTAEEDAALIVRAVNAHADLVGVLNFLEAHNLSALTTSQVGELDALLEKARTHLAKAGETP